MARWTRSRLSYANVMSTIAVFAVLGGTSYAAVKLPRNSVGASQIKTGGVGSSEVKNGALRKVDFKASELPLGAQGPQGLKGDKGDPGANGSDGANGAPGTVGAATVVFEQASVDLANGSNASYDVYCPSGKQAIAGGGRGDATLSEETFLVNTRPAISSGNSEPPNTGAGFMGWRITVVNPTGGAASGIRPEVWAVCVDAAT